MSELLVVDASVSLKWVLDDEDAVVQAVALRDAAVAGQYDLIAPSLWLYEVTNALVVAARRGRVTLEVANQALTLLMALGVRLVTRLLKRCSSNQWITRWLPMMPLTWL